MTLKDEKRIFIKSNEYSHYMRCQWTVPMGKVRSQLNAFKIIIEYVNQYINN